MYLQLHSPFHSPQLICSARGSSFRTRVSAAGVLYYTTVSANSSLGRTYPTKNPSPELTWRCVSNRVHTVDAVINLVKHPFLVHSVLSNCISELFSWIHDSNRFSTHNSHGDMQGKCRCSHQSRRTPALPCMQARDMQTWEMQ